MEATLRNMEAHYGPGAFAYSSITGERASANPEDYFWLAEAPDEPLTDSEGHPMQLVVEEPTEPRPLEPAEGEFSAMSAEFTTLERGDRVRASDSNGTVLEVGRDTEAGVSLATVVIEWEVTDDAGAVVDYESDLYEVPDMHHSSLPHLEVWCGDEGWQRVADLDFWAMREVEEAEQFFYEHAGWSYDSESETSEQGRERAARELAEAEAWARDVQCRFEWQDDPEKTDAEGCVMYDANNEPVASLWGIEGADDAYRRVVQAELALEVMAALDRHPA